MVNVLFHETAVIAFSYVDPSAPGLTGLRARRTLTLHRHAHCLSSARQVLACLLKTERDRSPSCGRLPADRIRRAATRKSQGLSESNLGRRPTIGYEDDWMSGGWHHWLRCLDRQSPLLRIVTVLERARKANRYCH